MLRKLLLISGVLLALGMLLAGCAGKEGEMGPAGPQGSAGPEGPQGPVGPAGPQGDAAALGAEYVGDQTCAGCHPDYYDTYIKSGHPWIMSKVVEGAAPDFPFTSLSALPEGYTWEDIAYVIGGYNWKALFVDLEGYIITDAPGASGNADFLSQFNFANDRLDQSAAWVPYHAGEDNLPMDCGSCHTTGYSPRGNQDDLPGLVGTWAQEGVRCEACHGPGGNHMNKPQGISMQIERDAELCGKCHVNQQVEVVDAADGFININEQYGELYQSKHMALECTTCHDPHMGVNQLREAKTATWRTTCESCHFKQAENQKNALHQQMGLACETCHMPYITKTAWGVPELHSADTRTHLFAINPNQIGQFNEDGTTSLSEVGLDFACRQCHRAGFATEKTDEELIEAATGYHDTQPAQEPTP
jgi:hypothetical protein